MLPKFNEIKWLLNINVSKIEDSPSDLILLPPKSKWIKFLFSFNILAILKAPSFKRLLFSKFNLEKFSSFLKIWYNISELSNPNPHSFN